MSILVDCLIYMICAVNTSLLGTNVDVSTRKLLIFLYMAETLVCFILGLLYWTFVNIVTYIVSCSLMFFLKHLSLGGILRRELRGTES